MDRGTLEQTVPYVTYEYVTVTFPSSPNTDYPVATALRPSDPEAIDYEPVRKDRSCDIYHDQSGTRQQWAEGYVVLRCSVADAVVDLCLSVRRT